MTDAKTASGDEPDLASYAPAHGASPNGAAEPAVDVAIALAAAEAASKRRRWPMLLAGVVIGGAATYATTAYLQRDDDADLVEREDVELATAAVMQQDLLEEIEWSGTLGYGEAISVSGNGGIITSATPVGATIDRGDVIATVDSAPVVALFGDTPMWRSLSEGDEGRDVRQLETNLVALGYDPDQTVDIDDTFTANTELMVERWQEDLGFEATGVVSLGEIVIVEGPSSLVSVGAVGSGASGEIASLAPRRSVLDIVSAVDGTITDIMGVGTMLGHGNVLFLVDDIPVVAITELDSVSAVFASETFTALELEEALADAGHDPDGEMTIDGVVTAATRTAIERWQTAAGLPVTGEADPGYYVVVPEGRIVETVDVSDGSSVITGGPILTASISRLSVDVVVEVADADEFEIDQTVTIELADETTVDGIVADISEVIRGTTPQDSPTVEIGIDIIADADQPLIEGPVTVLSVGESIIGATVVPTRALVSLAEGGFAVEKIDDARTSSLVGIELGTFDDGVVEVVEGNVAPGDSLVVPR